MSISVSIAVCPRDSMLPVAALLLLLVVLAAVTTTVSAARPSSPASSLSVPELPPVELRGADHSLVL